MKVGPTRFLMRERFLDSRFPPPHCSNVRRSDLIAIKWQAKNLPRHVRAVLLQGWETGI